MKIIKYIFFLFLLLLLSFWLFDYNFTKNQYDFNKIKKVLNDDVRYFLKKKSVEFIDFDFSINKTEDYFIENKKITLNIFSNKFLKYKYYLNQDKNNIFLISNTGIMFSFPKNNILNQKKIKLKNIKTNLEKKIGGKYIRDKQIVIKGMLIVNKKIYVSYINNNNGCYSNAILEGNLNRKRINFSPFFILNECKDIFNYATGGNMQNFKNNKILLTVGDYMSYERLLKNDPQNKNSYYGKILSIDLTTQNIDILSMGHRNQQGLYYDSKEDIIFSTEHGPKGGDEINVNVNPNKNAIKNYGWAISSYGEHYDTADEELEKIAPLNKSHKKYGFEEPIKDFTPSIGITQILKVNNFTNNDYKLLVGSLGYVKEEGDLTVHILNFNKNFKETKYNKIYTGERIRDMIDLNNGSILISLETTGSLGLLKNIY